jgi:hypothetical protein
MKSADVVQVFNTIGLGATVDIIPGSLPEQVQKAPPIVGPQIASPQIVGPPDPPPTAAR